MPLFFKTMEPVTPLSKREEKSEHALYLRLRDLAASRREVYGCTVQGGDGDFIVVLSDPDSGKELCAWSGSPDGVVLEFQQWLERKPLA